MRRGRHVHPDGCVPADYARNKLIGFVGSLILRPPQVCIHRSTDLPPGFLRWGQINEKKGLTCGKLIKLEASGLARSTGGSGPKFLGVPRSRPVRRDD